MKLGSGVLVGCGVGVKEVAAKLLAEAPALPLTAAICDAAGGAEGHCDVEEEGERNAEAVLVPPVASAAADCERNALPVLDCALVNDAAPVPVAVEEEDAHEVILELTVGVPVLVACPLGESTGDFDGAVIPLGVGVAAALIEG